MTREELEARAKELGVTFAANIGDEKLAERVAEAEAAAKGEGGLTAEGEASAESDEKAEQPPAPVAQENTPAKPAKGKKAAKSEDAAETVTVVCAIADGRRRGGRRWDGGANVIPADEYTDAMAKALNADPMFQVTEPK